MSEKFSHFKTNLMVQFYNENIYQTIVKCY